MTRPPNVELAIGELRLGGFDPHGRGDLQERITAALAARLAADADAWRGATDQAIDRLDLGGLQPGSSRQALAEAIASRIHAAVASRRDTPDHQT